MGSKNKGTFPLNILIKLVKTSKHLEMFDTVVWNASEC